jgi:hypothetical protein
VVVASLFGASLFGGHEAAFAACKLTPQSVNGAWERTSRAGYFEQMEFTSEGAHKVFNSWLHERPEVQGATWSLEHCVLRIWSASDASLSFEYAAGVGPRQRLELRKAGEPVAIYRRIKAS